MIDNPILAAMRERRSAHRFTAAPVDQEQLDAILEAGRWAPSATNSQPWDFVVVTDPALRAQLGTILREVTWAWSGFAAAPVVIVVSVDPTRDPAHFVEDGAVAAEGDAHVAPILQLLAKVIIVQFAPENLNTAVLQEARNFFGFNRRFSPHVARIRELLAGRSEPLALGVQASVRRPYKADRTVLRFRMPGAAFGVARKASD